MKRTLIVAAASAALMLLAAVSAACSAAPDAPGEGGGPATTGSAAAAIADEVAATAASSATSAPVSPTTVATLPPSTTALAEPDSGASLAAEIEGRWEGTVDVPGLGTLPVAIDLHVGDDGLGGTIDVQGNVGLPLSALVLEGTRLRFELKSPLGLIKWDGELRDGVIEGEFTQLSNTGAFTLHRPGAEPDVAAESDPVDGHRSEEVTFANGAFVLAGEVALPDGDGPHPAVVLINGSGDQDRDVTIGQFRLFADLAGHLAQAGIASLRWDDRGVGGSDGYGPHTTLEDRAGDVEAAVELLRTHPDIDADRIGLIGHSEGGFIAPIVANRSHSIAFVALLAGSAVPGDELLRMQLPRILRVAGTPPDEIARQQAHQELILQAILTGEGWGEAELSTREAVRRELESMSEEQRESIPDEEAFLDISVEQRLSPLRSRYFRSLVTHDPRPDLVGLEVPVLALFGELDTQVPPAANAAALSEAIAASAIPSYAIGTVSGANHLFQAAVTGSPDEYTELAPEFTPEFLQLLTDWLTAQTSR